MWGIAIGTFALTLVANLLAERLRDKVTDPRHRTWDAERDPYFNRDYARPEKKPSRPPIAA